MSYPDPLLARSPGGGFCFVGFMEEVSIGLTANKCGRGTENVDDGDVSNLRGQRVLRTGLVMIGLYLSLTRAATKLENW